MQEVVERSGQSLRTFYQYFAGQAGAPARAVRGVRSARRPRICRKSVAGVDDPLDRLHCFAVEYFRMCRLRAKGQAPRGPAPAIVEFAQQLLTSRTHGMPPTRSRRSSRCSRTCSPTPMSAGAVRADLDLRRDRRHVAAGDHVQLGGRRHQRSAGASTVTLGAEALWDLLLRGIGTGAERLTTEGSGGTMSDDVRTVRSFCRICTSVCGILVDVSGDEVVRVRGDQDHPLSHGYTCAKGRALPADAPPSRPHRAAAGARRRRARGRRPGRRASTTSGAGSAAIIEQHGPSAVGVFFGSGNGMDAAGYRMSQALHAAIGTPAKFSPLTIDGTAKVLVSDLVGGAVALSGRPDYDCATFVMFVGSNPVVSHGHSVAIPDPVSAIRELTSRADVWVVDPRPHRDRAPRRPPPRAASGHRLRDPRLPRARAAA